MLRKIKKKLAGIKYLIFSKKEKFEIHDINGKKILAVKGTVIAKKEQDEIIYNLLSQRSKNIFEIGCNIGQTAIVALTHDNIEKILLVDPNPEALTLANKNLIINDFIHRAQSFLGFVSNELDNKLTFYTIGHGASGSMYESHAETAKAIGSSYKVKTTTVDFLIDFFGWNPDFIKIDVEGAEALVLEGAKKLANRAEAKILVEMHSNVDLSMEENAEKVLKWCNETGYVAWYLKTNEKLTTANTIKDRGRCHLLLLPKNIDFPEYLKGAI